MLPFVKIVSKHRCVAILFESRKSLAHKQEFVYVTDIRSLDEREYSMIIRDNFC